LLPLLFAGVVGWIVIATLLDKPIQACIVLAIMAVGAPVFYLWRWRFPATQ
jgi:APA family basic amino acid/polyamine antiporter